MKSKSARLHWRRAYDAQAAKVATLEAEACNSPGRKEDVTCQKCLRARAAKESDND